MDAKIIDLGREPRSPEEVFKNPPSFSAEEPLTVHEVLHLRAEARQTAVELLISYAKDIVNMWPNISFRTLRTLNEKVMGLKEALEMLGK